MKIRKAAGIFAARWRGLSLWMRFAIAGFIVVVLVGGVYIVKNQGTEQTTEAPHLRSVQVANVSDMENDTTPLPLVGEVKSVNQAEIHAQSGGTITHLYKKLGSYVAAGEAIAEIENSSQRAALLQAQGALESAQAGVQKSGTLYGESKASALDTI